MAVRQRARHAEAFAHFPHLVLEQLAQRLDHLEPHALGQSADVVVGLDRGRWPVHGHRLDHVGIERSLREEVRVGNRVGRALERLDEGVADHHALLLGILDAAQVAQEPLRGVERLERNPQRVAEARLDLLALARAQQAVVDEEAVQALADRAVEQHRDHRRVDAAGHAAHDLAIADALAQRGDLRGDELVHGPGAVQPRDLRQEVLEQAPAELGVHDLGVELDAVQLARAVRHRRERAARRGREHVEARRELRDQVAVAHPDRARAGHAVEQRIRGVRAHELRAPVLAARLVSRRGLDATAERLHQELQPVADPEHGHALREQLRVELRRVLGEHARGSAGQHDGAGRELAHALDLDPRRDDLAVDVQLADPPRDELCELRAVVDDDYALRAPDVGRHLLSSQ